MGLGRGFGRGRGPGFGRGWRAGGYGVAPPPFLYAPPVPQPTREQEVTALKAQADQLANALDAVRARLEEVESSDES
jgi:hypothetical protein